MLGGFDDCGRRRRREDLKGRGLSKRIIERIRSLLGVLRCCCCCCCCSSSSRRRRCCRRRRRNRSGWPNKLLPNPPKPNGTTGAVLAIGGELDYFTLLRVCAPSEFKSRLARPSTTAPLNLQQQCVTGPSIHWGGVTLIRLG